MSYVWKKKEKEKEKISAQRISVSHAVMASGDLRGWLYRDMNLTPIPCSIYKQNHDAVSRRKHLRLRQPRPKSWWRSIPRAGNDRGVLDDAQLAQGHGTGPERSETRQTNLMVKNKCMERSPERDEDVSTY